MADNYSVAFWRPNSSGKGAGAIFTLNDNGQAWLTVMPQAGEKKFNREAGINVKIGQADIGALLSVASYRVEGIGKPNDAGFWSGLLHTFNETTTAITLNVGKNNPGYYLGVSRKTGDGQPVRMGVGISAGDLELLRVFLERAAWASMFSTFEGRAEGGSNDTEEGNEAPAAPSPAKAPQTAPQPAAGGKPRGRPAGSKQAAAPVGASTDSGGNVPF